MPQHQVVYVHDFIHCNAGSYYCYGIDNGILQLIYCYDTDFRPIGV